MALSEKQARFAKEYLIDLNATRAAIRSGYSQRSAKQRGSKLMHNPAVIEAIEEQLAEKDAALVAKGDEVLRYLTGVMRGEEDEEKVFVADGRSGVATYTSQANRIKAAELLARCNGMLIQKVESAPVQVTFVDDLADDG